jgi:hypothetical protein
VTTPLTKIPARLVDLAGELAQAKVTGLPADLAAKVDLASPQTITGAKTHAAQTKVSGWGDTTAFPNGIFHKIKVDDGVNPDFNFNISSHLNNLPNPRRDVIVQLGFNTAPGSVEDPTQLAFSDNFEIFYTLNGVEVVERHVGQIVLPDGRVIRPSGFALARDGTSAGHSFRGTRFEYLDMIDASIHALWTVGGSFQLLKNNYFLHNTNNLKWLRQYQAGSSVEVSLIYLDSSNVHQVGEAFFPINFPGPAATFAGSLKLTGTIGLINGDTLVTTNGLRANGTLWIGNGADYIFQNTSGTLQTSNRLRVGGALVANQDQVASAAESVFRIRPSAGQAGMLLACEVNDGSVVSGFRNDGSLRPASLADGLAANNTLYYSSTQSKLTYKDAAGVLYPQPRILSATATLDFGSTAAQSSTDLTVSVTGAVVGDAVTLGLPASPAANTCFTAWVSSPDTCTVRHNNYSSGAVDPASGTYRITVIKP